MGHVDEGDADLLLDGLQLDLHLLAELEVERAERLVEEQDARPVDQRRASATRWRWPPDSWLGLRVS